MDEGRFTRAPERRGRQPIERHGRRYLKGVNVAVSTPVRDQWQFRRQGRRITIEGADGRARLGPLCGQNAAAGRPEPDRNPD